MILVSQVESPIKIVGLNSLGIRPKKVLRATVRCQIVEVTAELRYLY